RRARAEQKDSPDPQRGPCQAARPGWTAAFGSPASLPWHRPPHCAAVEASSKGLTLPHPRGVPQILGVAGAAATVLGVVDHLFGGRMHPEGSGPPLLDVFGLLKPATRSRRSQGRQDR